MRLLHRHKHHQLHGAKHVNKQRLTALLMLVTGVMRCFVWFALLCLLIGGNHLIRHEMSLIVVVAGLSLYANLATDWSQVTASYAGLVAGDAHHDAESNRQELERDFKSLDEDIEKLAVLYPGRDAEQLAQQIRERLK